MILADKVNSLPLVKTLVCFTRKTSCYQKNNGKITHLQVWGLSNTLICSPHHNFYYINDIKYKNHCFYVPGLLTLIAFKILSSLPHSNVPDFRNCM